MSQPSPASLRRCTLLNVLSQSSPPPPPLPSVQPAVLPLEMHRAPAPTARLPACPPAHAPAEKHAAEKNRPTDIICKFFLDAVEKVGR